MGCVTIGWAWADCFGLVEGQSGADYGLGYVDWARVGTLLGLGQPQVVIGLVAVWVWTQTRFIRKKLLDHGKEIEHPGVYIPSIEYHL